MQVVMNGLSLGGALRVQQRFAQYARAHGFELELVTTALRASAEAEMRLATPLQLVTAIAGGVDLVRFEAQVPQNSGWSEEPRRVRARPVFAPEAGLHWHTASVNLRLIADLTVLVVREHFDVSLDGVRSELLSPARWQPGLRAEARVAMSGGQRPLNLRASSLFLLSGLGLGCGDGGELVASAMTPPMTTPPMTTPPMTTPPMTTPPMTTPPMTTPPFNLEDVGRIEKWLWLRLGRRVFSHSLLEGAGA